MEILVYALLIGGYALFYYGLGNVRSGGKGPSLASTFGFTNPIQGPGDNGVNANPGLGQAASDAGKAVAGSVGGMGSSNQTGQPPTSNTSPGQVVRNV